MLRRSLIVVIVVVISVSQLEAESPKDLSVEEIVQRHRDSIVVITSAGRDGKRTGLGTGFVVSNDGLIATNFHVIGEGRAIAVEMPSGTTHEVVAIHATDRQADLAIVRIERKGLPSLTIADSNELKDGQSVIGLGNPQGLKNSVVSGVVSGKRTIDGRELIQLAIPLEPGNSGGPLLDRQGKVRGVLTMKSAVTANLGFAVPSNALRPLLAKPNPIPMSRWLTIGALDPDDWKPVFGGRWKQRAGRIQVEGAGQGFGGRALCLWQHDVPKLPFDLSVSVKLDDDSGAAGLAFHADGANLHYGFYPSGGEMRLTRFDGPDVFSWKILAQVRSDHYRSGDWNQLRVRFEAGKFLCYLNDHLIVESSDQGYTTGRVGLAKFRETKAEFRGFRAGKPVAPVTESAARVAKEMEKIEIRLPPPADLIDKLAPDAAVGLPILRDKARQLERQAAQLRAVAAAVHQKRVRTLLLKALSGNDDKIDLIRAAILVAMIDNEDLDVDSYRADVDRMGRKLRDSIPRNATELEKLTRLNKYFTEERGFHGSRGDYYHRANSYLNEVIDDREGIPITLTILYADLARQIGLRVEGIGLPGHFVARLIPAKGEPMLIDVFDGAKPLSRDDAVKKVEAIAGIALTDDHLKPVPKRAIIVRMLQNLLNITREEQDVEGALRYLDAMIDLSPDLGRERWMRAVLSFQTGRKEQAQKDVEWLLENKPAGVNLRQVEEFQRLMERGL
jgi:regulator of sirC expression with transglutaminase-like and TPR domain